MSLAKGLSILFVISKNKLLVLLIFTLKEMGIPDHLTSLLRNRKEQLELDMEQQTSSK